jgi:hypothetical protein
MSEKIYLIKSTVHPWRVWKTTNPYYMEEHLRFKDAKNHYPIIVPPTKGDRMDYISDGSSINGYTYKTDGWVIIIRNGFIYQIVSNEDTFTYNKTLKVKWKEFKQSVKSLLNRKK